MAQESQCFPVGGGWVDSLFFPLILIAVLWCTFWFMLPSTWADSCLRWLLMSEVVGLPRNEFKIFINIASSFSKKHYLPADTRFPLCPPLATPPFFMLFDFCHSDGWTMVSLHGCTFVPLLFILGSSSSQVSAFPSGPGKRQSLQDSVTILRPRAPGQLGSCPRVDTSLFLFWKAPKSALPGLDIPGSPASLQILAGVVRKALLWISLLKWIHPLPSSSSLATIWVFSLCQALGGSHGLLI